MAGLCWRNKGICQSHLWNIIILYQERACFTSLITFITFNCGCIFPIKFKLDIECNNSSFGHWVTRGNAYPKVIWKFIISALAWNVIYSFVCLLAMGVFEWRCQFQNIFCHWGIVQIKMMAASCCFAVTVLYHLEHFVPNLAGRCQLFLSLN